MTRSERLRAMLLAKLDASAPFLDRAPVAHVVVFQVWCDGLGQPSDVTIQFEERRELLHRRPRDRRELSE